MVKPLFVPDFVKACVTLDTGILVTEEICDLLREEVPWVNKNSPRDECFMAVDTQLTYSYGRNPSARTYQAAVMHPVVRCLMSNLNSQYGTAYNVCVLNYYEGRHQHLGWHADDSPEQDHSHPIAVISFGAARFIYVKEQQYKGTVPDEDKYLLTPGSLFVMPGGYQQTHFHKIPKHDQECGGRVSLTYRKLDR